MVNYESFDCQIFAQNYFDKNIGRKETTHVKGLFWLLRNLKYGAKWFDEKWKISTIEYVYIKYL